jgi:acyl carrier protein
MSQGADTTIQDETQAAIHEFILQQFPTARKRGVSETDSLLEQGIIDSMGILELVNFIEGRFSITLTDDEMVADHFESIQSMALLVRSKQGAE